MNIEVQWSKSLFKTFSQQKGGAFGNNIGKEPQKPRPKLHREGTAKATPKIEKHVYYIFTENISSTYNPMQVVVFLQTLIL